MEELLASDVLSKAVFYPRKNSEPVKNQHFIECRDGTKLACSYFKSKSSRAKTMILFHGNGELVEDQLFEYTGSQSLFSFLMNMKLNLVMGNSFWKMI